MARSWDDRVRGASQKTASPARPTPDPDHDLLDDAPSDDAPHDEVEAVPVAAEVEVEVEEIVEYEPAPSVDPAALDAADRRTADAELVANGLAMAVEAAELAVAVAERSTGLIRWTSDQWIERFGERDLLARHMPTSTEFGEAPLPAPGEAWQRTRTLILADGAERLSDLLMVGGDSRDGKAFVTVVALESMAGRPVITDRSELIGVIDGAVSERRDGSVAVLYVDIDRFKVVHDLVGNIEALRLLDLVNERIAATVRGTDLLFRLHSDEFVIVSSELEHPEKAEELAERVRGAVATLTDVRHNLALTCSVGVAVSEEESTGENLLSAAETAVYVAKGRGRNRIAVHDEELRSRTERLMVVERQLREAIDRRDVGFAYQPMVDLATGEVVGAEALLRLGGDIGLSAVEVVAAAEHSGLMGALGVLVLDGVQDQLGEFLRADGRRKSIMVNMSATQLADEDLVRALAKISSDADITPGRIALEIPEVVVRDHRVAVETLAKLVRPTFRFGIDGFGTGAVDPAELEELPIDYVKLHRGVTVSMAQAEGDRHADLRAMIASVRARGVDVVGLGVESDAQVEALLDYGVGQAQGFLYAGAVTVERLLELFEAGFPAHQRA